MDRSLASYSPWGRTESDMTAAKEQQEGMKLQALLTT